jgi:RND family efflux transporter MFP subunit
MASLSLKSLALAGLLGSAALAAVAQPAATSTARPAEDPYAIRVLLAPALETTLVSQVVGRIAAVNVNLGDKFAKGKTLISFDCGEQSARLQMANAELASARDTHEAKLRLQGLQQAGEVEVSMAANNTAKAQAQVSLYRAQLSQCAIVAPFSGRAVKIAVKPHQGVNQAQPLIEIVSDGPLKLRLNAPAKWVSWLKPGTPFEVTIDETGKRYKAKVSALNARIDAVSQTIELEATIADTAPDLLPGMSGIARFTPPAQ